MNHLFEMRNAVKSINLRGNREKGLAAGKNRVGIKRNPVSITCLTLSLNFLLYEIKGSARDR